MSGPTVAATGLISSAEAEVGMMGMGGRIGPVRTPGGNPTRTHGRRDLWTVVFVAGALLLFAALVSYDPRDIPFLSSSVHVGTRNWIGIIGAQVSGGLRFLVGHVSLVLPTLLLVWGLARHWFADTGTRASIKWAATGIFLVSLAGLAGLWMPGDLTSRFDAGGLVGLAISDWLERYFGRFGGTIVAGLLAILSLFLVSELLLWSLMEPLNKRARAAAQAGWTWGLIRIGRIKPAPAARPQTATRATAVTLRVAEGRTAGVKEGVGEPRALPKLSRPAPVRIATPGMNARGQYRLPEVEVLDQPPPIETRQLRDNLTANARVLEETLADFGLEVKVVHVERGPAITRYELQPAPGVKVQKITSLSDDLALAMKAASVRIVAPIPGKGLVGVEVPNVSQSTVYLREILETPAFRQASSKIPLALGKDVSGEPLIADLGDMPHILIAGTTGSGKTVCVNSIITSLLFRSTPDELNFLMVDPKMVELAMFNDLPHLLAPVVTDPKKVAGALGWVVSEMERRYQLFAKVGVRNIEGYHQRMAGNEITDEHAPARLPYIVVIIDELADLMLMARAEIENAIARLAQLSRAVGIHMVLATQRPSVDVITGVIKANFPARISFQVAAKVDSRTVLDMIGADKLLGKGDMLFLQPGTAKPIRAQGSFVQDQEIERVVKFCKEQRSPVYNEAVLKEQEKRVKAGYEPEFDELFEEAAKMVIETKQASVSMLQRRLRLSYQRAGRLIDMMEAEGLIGSFRGTKPREILIDQFPEHLREKYASPESARQPASEEGMT